MSNTTIVLSELAVGEGGALKRALTPFVNFAVVVTGPTENGPNDTVQGELVKVNLDSVILEVEPNTRVTIPYPTRIEIP